MKLLIFLFGILFVFIVNANSNTQPTSISSTNILSDKEISIAAEWQLTEKEYVRYKDIMDGPRGNWSPGIDPITVLGIEAKDATEKKYYAELLAQIEHERSLKEIGFQIEYDQAFQRLFPNEKLFSETIETPSRITLITTIEHASLGEKITRYAELYGIDIYVKNAKSNKEIQQWAFREKLSPKMVKNKSITLNHHNNTLPDVSKPTFFKQTSLGLARYDD